MADREQLYTALRNADAAGDTAAAQRLASYIRSLPADAAPAAAPQRSTFGDATAGAAMGVSDLGNTLLNAASYLPGKVTDAIRSAVPAQHRKRIPDIAQMNRSRNAEIEAITEQNKDSTAFGMGRLAGNIGVTLPVGGAVGQGVKSLAQLPRLAGAAPRLTQLGNAAASGGMRTGANLGAGASRGARAADLGTRVAGGAISGGAAAGLVNPGDAGAGAVIGGVLPSAVKGVGKALSRSGAFVRAAVQPMTDTGQKQIAAKLVREFGEGGPMNVDATELVPGSRPTLAEATGNAGIAGLQRVTRDLRPNAFVEREATNASAREAAFDSIAGDRAAIESSKAARDSTAEALYGRAFNADSMRQSLARESQQMRAPFSGVGLSGAPEDLATPGLRELIQRPTFRQAAGAAQRLAANNGVELADPLQSLQGLHYIKLALDDALNPAAASAMGRNETRAIMGMRDKLAEELAKVSPTYGAARQTFAEMSQPINAMEALQDLRLTDGRGNMTLSKVKNAVEGLERKRREPGVNNAKSINEKQLKKIKAIQADLLRQSNLALGKSVGSPTLQNLSINNMLTTLLPGKTGGAINGKIGTAIGQVGKLAYSGADEKIRANLVDFMLDPARLPQLPPPRAPTLEQLRAQAIRDQLGAAAYRAAPILGSSQ